MSTAARQEEEEEGKEEEEEEEEQGEGTEPPGFIPNLQQAKLTGCVDSIAKQVENSRWKTERAVHRREGYAKAVAEFEERKAVPGSGIRCVVGPSLGRRENVPEAMFFTVNVERTNDFNENLVSTCLCSFFLFFFISPSIFFL